MNAKPSELVNQAVRSKETFSEVIPHIKSLIRTADQSTCKAVISRVKEIIKDKKFVPPQKVLALDIFQECMMVRNNYYIAYAQTKVLDRFSILASKKSADLFKDSTKSPEFRQASEKFLENLLTYIQMWAHQFGKTANGEITLYTNLYLKLKEKNVVFPQAKSQVTVQRHPPPPVEAPVVRNSHKKVKNDQETIGYFENLLTIVEEIEDPYNDETGKELIGSMLELRKEIEEMLNNAISTENSEEIDKLFNLNERMQKIIEKKKSPQKKNHFNTMQTPNRKTEILPPVAKIEESSNKRNSTPPKNDIFQNILDLDFSPNVAPNSSQFYTYQPSNPSLFSPPLPKENEKKNVPSEIFGLESEQKLKGFELPKQNFVFEKKNKEENLESQQNKYAEKEIQLNAKENELLIRENELKIKENEIKAKENELKLRENNVSSLETKNYELKASIKEMEETITLLNQNYILIQTRNNELENSLKQTISILKSKEQECEEFHCLKQELKKPDIIDELLLSPRTINRTVTIEINEKKADNENIYRLICVENYAVLFDNEILQLGYQLINDPNLVKMLVYIGNKSDDAIEDINLVPQKSAGFNVQIPNTHFQSILPRKQCNFEIFSKFLSFTHIIPRIALTFEHKSRKISYSLKIPINITKYDEVIDADFDQIWDEWEEMMFSSDSLSGKCSVYQQYLPKILRFSSNSKIFESKDTVKLHENQFLVAVKVKELALAIVSVENNLNECEIECRSNDNDMRKAFLNLVASQIID